VLLGKDETGALVVDSVLSFLQCFGNVDSREDIRRFKTVRLIPTVLFQNNWGRISRVIWIIWKRPLKHRASGKSNNMLVNVSIAEPAAAKCKLAFINFSLIAILIYRPYGASRKLRYRRRTARYTMSAKILSNATQLYKESHLKRLTVVK